MWLPTWQPSLSGVKVHTPCVNGIRAESLVFTPVSWAFPSAPSARRRGRPDVRSPRGGGGGGAGPQAAARAPRAWVRASIVRPSLCSGLPLEATSRPYIILASLFYCSRWTFFSPGRVEVHGCQITWSRQRAASTSPFSQEETVESRSSVLQWWSHWTDPNLGQLGSLISLGFNYSGENGLPDLVTKILPALEACYSRCQLFLCPRPVREDNRERGLSSLGYCLPELSLHLWVWLNLNLASGWVLVIMALNDFVL